jgi:hypothetical protein
MPVARMLDWVRGHSVLKGEAVVMVRPGVETASGDAGANEVAAADVARTAAIKGFKAGKSLKDLLKELGGLGLSRSDLYQLLLDIKAQLEQGGG